MADHEKVYSVRFITDQAEASIKRLESFVSKFEKTVAHAFGGANISKAVDSLSAKIKSADKSSSTGFRKIDDAALRMRAQIEKSAAAMARVGTVGATGTARAASGVTSIAAAFEQARRFADSLDRSLGRVSRDGATGAGPVAAGMNAASVATDRTKRAADSLDAALKRASKGGAAGMREIGRAVKSAETAVRQTDEAITRMTRVKGEREKARALREIERRIQGIGSSSRLATMSITGMMARMSALLGIARGVRAIGDEFIGYDKAMVGASIRFDETMRVGTAGYTNMRREVRRLAVDAGTSIEAAAKSTEAWAKAGLDWRQTEKVMPVTLRASLAMDLPDPGAAGDLLSDALGQFQMRTSDTAQLEKNIKRISDVTLKAADISTLDATDLFDSYKKGAPMVAAMDETIEQLAADLVTLGNAGIKGEEAGTMIRSIFGALTAPRGPAKEVMKKLGVEINDVNGKFRGLTNIIADFEESTRNIGSGERVGMLTKVVGRENISGFLDLLSSGADEIRKVQTELEASSGTMDKVADQMEKSVAKKWDRLKSRVIDAGISVIEQTDLFGKLGEKVESINWDKVSETISKTVVPALEKIGNIISNVIIPAIKKAVSILETVFAPVLFLASKALDSASKSGSKLSTVLGVLVAAWASYRVAVAAGTAFNLVKYFAQIVTGAASAAAAQASLGAATTGAAAATAGFASKIAMLPSLLGPAIAALLAGAAAGTAFHDSIMDPVAKKRDETIKRDEALADSMSKENDKSRTKSVLESDLSLAKRKFEEIHSGLKSNPEAMRRAEDDYKSGRGNKRNQELYEYIKRLENKIALKKTEENIGRYDVSGREDTYQSIPQSGSVTEYEEDFSEGSFQMPEPLRVKVFADPQKQTFEYDELFEVADQSVPVSFPTPKAFETGQSFQGPEDFYLDQSLPQGVAPTSFETFDKMYELQLQTSEESREFQKKMLDGALSRASSVDSSRVVNQTVNYTAPNITIDASGMSADQAERMMKRVLRDDQKSASDYFRDSANSAGGTEF